MTTLNGQSEDILNDNIAALRELFPEVCCEGKVDFDKLKQVLGEYTDDSAERYNFTWNGKGQALRLSQMPSMGTLRPCKEESKNWDDTQNLYIEGDNLEVLKLLQKSYHGKIKMIYIDPPYNTGNDFVYPDDFSDSLENYKEITGQVDAEGSKLSTNSEANGRYHTDWLNMMYPRLRLARNLLTDDGVIFISIDDNEDENMKKTCGEVFGENNFIAQAVWQKRTSPDARRIISAGHEYVMIFAKNLERNESVIKLLPFSDRDKNLYKNPDNDPRGPWVSTDCTAQAGHGTKSQFYTLTTPAGRTITLPDSLCWRFTQDKMNEEIEAGRIWFGQDGKGVPRKKTYLSERAGRNLWTWWPNTEVGHTQSATQELTKLLGGKLFDFSKPKELISRCLSISTAEEDIILDFFSGSATTAHAVMQLNAEDGGNRRFIMVQLPEPCAEGTEAAKAGYKNICEIGKERIRRAGEKIKAENEAKSNMPLLETDTDMTLLAAAAAKGPAGIFAVKPLFKRVDDSVHNLDIGFKDFKLDTSNLKKWQPDADELEQSLFDSISNYVEGRTELDVVYEIMLKMGLDLTWPLETNTYGGKNVYAIGMGALMICLDDHITPDVAEGMVSLHKELAPETWKVVFKDNGFADDSAKVNIKEILKCAGLEEDAFTTV